LSLDFPTYVGSTTVEPSTSAEVNGRRAVEAHLSRELHDQVAQPLIGLILELHRLRNEHLADHDLAGELATAADSVRQVLKRTREMLIDLRGQQELRLDFVEALRNEILTANKGGARLEVSSRWPAQINGWASFNLLRIVQEAVANASRHGRAQRIDIFLDTTDDDYAVVVVVDDGVGVGGAPSDFGLIGMSERALILGGGFSIGTRVTGGTRVEVRVPMENLR
jgi:signal transduction histidine kinase